MDPSRTPPLPSIVIVKDGPYLVSGGVPLAKQWIVINGEGESVGYQEGESYQAPSQYALCRCGASAGKPFCDGSHAVAEFDGSETADREPYRELADTLEGPEILLTDQEELCAFARFCDAKGRIWNLIEESGDPEKRRIVEEEAGNCPSGRLAVWDRATGAAIEPKLPPSIGLIEDTEEEVSGPLWVRGGIPIFAADGTPYEVRNRITLCRCGRSKNKPFCDGAHVASGFSDEA